MLGLDKRGHISVQILSSKGGMLVFEGYASTDTVARGFVLKDTSGACFEPRVLPCSTRTVEIAGEDVCYENRFELSVPLQDGCVYEFAIQDADSSVTTIPSLGLWAKLSNKKPVRGHTYWCTDGYIVQYASKQFKISLYSAGLHRKLEKRFLSDMRQAGQSEYAKIRKLAQKRLKHKKRDIWIISDRIFKGGDNGENFFKYAVKQPQVQDKDLYFLFDGDENPVDYKRISSYGKVVKPGTLEYKVLFLCADKIISSHFGRSVTSPFLDDYYYFKDLYNFDYVYLTHGVMPGDLSAILNKLNKNMALVVTSSEAERRSILEGNYYYSEREVKLTGMPRHDALGSTPVKRRIAFLPTWRRGLAGDELQETRDRTYSAEFKNSGYCAFYNALINDERLLSALEKTGYVAEFYVHPSFRKQAGDFHGNSLVKVGADLADYEAVLNESALMVTDYSSVAFDFGYLRKPIVYCQFDSEEMEANHFYERGYFDYRRDGFGPVTQTLDETVEAIVEYLENDCANIGEYRARADAFFAYSDQLNCKRVFDAIMALDTK